MAKDKKVKRPSALKRELQSEKRRLQNKAFKSKVRTVCRTFEEALNSNDTTKISTSLNAVYSAMDRAVKKGVYTKNKASRIKSRLCNKATPATS